MTRLSRMIVAAIVLLTHPPSIWRAEKKADQTLRVHLAGRHLEGVLAVPQERRSRARLPRW